MKFQHILLVFAAIACISFSSCVGDTQPPSVILNTPSESDVFVNGNTIQIQGVAEDKHGLSQVSIEITLASHNDSLLFEKTDQVSTAPYSISANYTVNVPDSSLIEIHLEATDKAGNTNDTHVHLPINN